MEKILEKFNKIILGFVLIVMMIVLALGSIHLVVSGVQQIIAPPKFLLDVTSLTDIFSIVLILIIGLELIETIAVAYTESADVRILVEPIVLIAIIAIGRKVIVLDIAYLDPFVVLAIAAIFLSLSLGYYLLRKDRQQSQTDHLDEPIQETQDS